MWSINLNLSVLCDDIQGWWPEQLSWTPDDYSENQMPYRTDAANLKRFLENEILPWCERRRQEFGGRPLICEQAIGEAVDPERLDRHEDHT